ncbi:unnamed protein product [Paramecium primaurelia]|uniref:Uncharacterized protein n=1 Tax=Paramecium primaurelia TaxID=5886 RepID=A0A8S1QPE3_PARPR|nr:unnamed protein product [Paramecium primaurelia]
MMKIAQKIILSHICFNCKFQCPINCLKCLFGQCLECIEGFQCKKIDVIRNICEDDNNIQFDRYYKCQYSCQIECLVCQNMK